MHSLKRLAVGGQILRKAVYEPYRSPSICIFCEHHVTTRRRAFTKSASFAAGQPTSAIENGPASLEEEALIGTQLEPDYDLEGWNVLAESQSDALHQRKLALQKRAKIREETRRKQQQIDKIQEAIEANPDDLGYAPAETWAGLRMLGGKYTKDKVQSFESFFKTSRIQGQAHITAATYRALVETLAAMTAGKDANIPDTYAVANLLNATRDVKVTLRKGEVQLSYPNAGVEDAVLAAGSPWEVDSGPATKLTKIDDYLKSWGSQWQSISIAEPKFKFAFIRRLAKILGRPIPDYQIHSSPTVAALLSQIARPDPPKNVYESLLETVQPTKGITQKETPKTVGLSLLDLPNIKVSPTRQTQIDTEKSLGRWKVISQELRKRGLPVYGRQSIRTGTKGPRRS